MSRYIYYILILLIGLSGCKMGSNFVKPNYQSPSSYRFDTSTTDTIVNIKWWNLFNDPILDTLIKIALDENKDVLMAAAKIEAARAKVGYNKADIYPSLNISAGVSGGNFTGAKSDKVTKNYNVYPELVWEIDLWGKYRRLTEEARAELLAYEYNMRGIQMSLISSVTTAYFNLLDNKSKLQISKNTLASRDSGLIIIQAKYDYGTIAEIDLNQAQVQRAIAAVSIPIYKRNIANNESELCILLGRNPDSIHTGIKLSDQQFPPEIPSGLPSQLLQRRPDILQAEAEYMAQNARVGAAIAMRFPTISLTGLLGIASNDLSTLTSGGMAWSAGANLLGPIFQFGKNKRQVEIERYNAKVTLLNYENTVIQAFKEVEDALITIETLNEEFTAQQFRFNAAVNAEKLSQHRYDKGVTSYLEVLDSQRQSFDAQLDYSQTRQELLNAYVVLYKALGGGWTSE